MPFIHPDKIIVPEGRYRTDFACVESRAEDIRKIGQLVPILCRYDETRNLILVDGECRVRACQLLNREVWYTTNQDGQVLIDNDFQHRLAELMCNLSREDMNPVDKARGIADIDRLMKEIHGQSGQNATRESNQEGHSSADTAKMLGYKTRKTVNNAIMISRAVEVMPELSTANTMSEAMTMIRTKGRLELQQELARRRSTEPQKGPISDPLTYFSERLVLGNCLTGLKSLPSNIASIFLTDIPYGTNYKPESPTTNKSENKDLSKKVLGFYEDNPDIILPLVESVIEQMARIGRPNCHVYMFCAFRWWSYLCSIFNKYKFDVYNKPIIWVKGDLTAGRLSGGVCRLPAKWPASNSDCILFACRGDVILEKQGQPDVLIELPVQQNQKIHNVQQSVPLLVELISRVFHPNTKGLLIDPFAGSGASLAAAMRFEGLDFLGYELDPDNRERAIAFLINEYTRLMNPEPIEDLGDLEL